MSFYIYIQNNYYISRVFYINNMLKEMAAFMRDGVRKTNSNIEFVLKKI
jgi:hypothetical protein